jgi:hypothetical protein
MDVKTLIEKLQKLDPNTIVVGFDDDDKAGYKEVHFMDGTHCSFPGGDGEFMKQNHAKWVRGVGKTDFYPRLRKSKAKPIKFVILY